MPASHVLAFIGVKLHGFHTTSKVPFMPPKDAKAKKLERKAEAAAVQARLNKVREALYTEEDRERDLLAELRPFCTFDRNGVAATLSFCSPKSMSSDVREFVFDLTKENMEAPYIEAGWGWNDAKKRRELYDPVARFIVFRRTVPPPETVLSFCACANSAFGDATSI
jgi:hypothetical protein